MKKSDKIKELEKSARRRGYKKGVTCIFGTVKDKRTLLTSKFYFEDNMLCVRREKNEGDIIFKNNEWVEIIKS